MGLFRDESGRVIEIADDFADARGYTPLSDAERNDINTQRGLEARGTERGIIGEINAAATGLASGLTLGASDWALGKLLPDAERERLLAEMEAHPYLRAGGEIVGAVGGAVATGGSSLARTPAGYLGQAANKAVGSALAQGGVKGTARALLVMGGEGAAQSAGQYIGHTSLADKEITAEGLVGSGAMGLAFGAGGGGAALGVVNGVVAGRRLYSRVMGGQKAADAAESSWSIASAQALEADTATARAAEAKLENIRIAKTEALRGRNSARSAAQEAALDAQGARAPREAGDFEAGIPTDVRARPEAPSAAPAETTKVIPKGAADLEAQLAGTKAQLDEGAALKDIRPEPDFAESGKTFGGREPDIRAKVKELQRQGRTKEGMIADRQATLSEIRYKATEDLLGPQIAKQEQILADLVDEFKAARADFEGLVAPRDADAFAGPQKTAAASPGNRKAVEIIDDAHEEALLRSKFAADPQEAGRAITEAEELENLLEGLAAPRLHGPDVPMSRGELRSPNAKQWTEELADAAEKIKRYETASAKLADEIGDASHPASAERTKVLRAAESDSERKMYERTARATDDAADGIHPKKAAAKAARKAQNDAQTKLDELNVQHSEAKHDFSAASKKVREGEAAKKAAEKADAKLAGAAGGFGAADAGGIMEIIDIPGMPKPSDLPIVGPLLGAFLTFRTLKKAMGRAMGKVPATADARVAVLASQTRDRVARAVDRSIGALQRGAKGMTKVWPPVAGVLAARIYDDGDEDPKTKDIQDLAAARMRELASYVHTPNAIERDVRRQLAEVTDPDIIAAAEVQRRAAMEHLLSVAPKMPEPNLLNPVKYRPSGAQALSFARSVDAVNDPAGVFERLAHEQAMISLEAAEALRKVYPRIFAEAGMRLMERAQQGDLKVPMRMRVQMSLLYKVPLDSALDPVNLKITQSVYERKTVMPPPGMQGGPTQPSIANPVNLSQGLTPAADRR